LLRQKSEVFAFFRDFQSLVERQFDRKIRSFQTNWGGEYSALSSYFTRMGISIISHALMRTNKMAQPSVNIAT
jgi:hypothetical protein